MFVMMDAVDDIETQKRGAVGIIHQMNPNALVCADPQERAYVYRMLECVPLRLGGVHFCVPDNPLSHSVKAVTLLAIGANRRTRTRFHTGKFLWRTIVWEF
jgi:hypothetical protein